MSTVDVDPILAPHAEGAAVGNPVPCAARPSTGFLHLDGPCRCFFGGPAPEFAPAPTYRPLAHAS